MNVFSIEIGEIRQYMTMIIEEKHKMNVSIIFQEDIELKQYAY